MSVTPNLLLGALIGVCMAGPPLRAGALAFLAGALTDLMWGRVFGINTLLFLYLALGACAVNEAIFKRSYFIDAGVVFVGSLIYDLALYLLSFTLWGEGHCLFLLMRVAVPAAAYTAICHLLVSPVTSALFPYMPEKKVVWL
jgi:cell shape-determining protein MreD